MATKLPSRFFYRCTDCLTVVATDTPVETVYNQRTGRDDLNVVCDACEGKIEFMGEAKRYAGTVSLHTVVGYKCVCDAKCTNALGPNCDCVCGGENHGSQRVVAVVKTSSLPRLMVPKNAVEKAVEFRALCTAYKAAHEAKYADVNRRKSEGFIRDFDFYMDGQYAWGAYLKAKHLKTHAGRAKRLAALTADLKKSAVAA